LKFHSNYAWNLIHKTCTEYAQKAFFLFLENTLLSLLTLIFFSKESLSYWSFNDPYKLFKSYSNWPLNSTSKSFFFPKYLKWRNADCFSYLLGKYSRHKIIIMCWVGEIYSQPLVRLSLTLSLYSGMTTKLYLNPR